MKIAQGVFFAFAFLVASPLYAQQSTTTAETKHIPNSTKAGDVGLGIMVGTPTALNMKFWTQEDRAVNVGVGYSGNDLALMGDYLWHFRRVYSAERGPSAFAPYIGLGALAIFNTTGNTTGSHPLYQPTNDQNGPAFGGRIPLGLEFLPYNVPLGVFAEIAPGLIFAPTSTSFVQADVGARYYF